MSAAGEAETRRAGEVETRRAGAERLQGGRHAGARLPSGHTEAEG